MMSKLIKRVVSLIMCIGLLSYVSYADTVVIGQAPNSNATGKTLSQSANTSYLTNQYTGPGTAPNSASFLGTSPIQSGVTYDYSAGQTSTFTDENGVGKGGPTVQTISSPAKNNQTLKTTTGTIGVITNGAEYLGSQSSSTSDTGPTVKEIKAPSANGEKRYNSSGVIIDGQEQYQQEFVDTPNVSDIGSNEQIPSYTTATGDANVVNNSDIIIYQANNNIAAVKPNISAPAAIAVNATTRQVYYSKDGFGIYAPAALANIVTATILLSYKGLDDVLLATATATTGLESGASTAGLKAGDTITVRDAIAAMFVKSCCDVSNVVAENVSGSIPAFVALMNQTVRDWGCIATNFVNPTGLNNDMQITNVYDMAVIMDKATQNPTIKTMLSIEAYNLPATATRAAKSLTTKNNLLKAGSSMKYAGIASRMGYTSKAKYTIASEIDYNGQRLIAVVLKANGSQFTDTTKLLNFAKVACVELGGTSSVNNVNQATNNSAVANAVNSGDAIGTWQKDNTGWYFVKSDGTYANNEWIKQNGKMYCVDSTGYMITGWREFSNGKLYYFDPLNGEFRYNTWVNVSTGAYYLQSDGSLAQADKGTTKNIVTTVGTYTIDDTGKAIAKIS